MGNSESLPTATAGTATNPRHANGGGGGVGRRAGAGSAGPLPSSSSPSSSEATPLLVAPGAADGGPPRSASPSSSRSPSHPPRAAAQSARAFSATTAGAAALGWILAGAAVALAVGGLWRGSGSGLVGGGVGAGAASSGGARDAPSSPAPPPRRYRRFQAVGLSLYTGGAPLYLPDGSGNPECRGRERLGRVGHLDEEVDDGRDNLYCYLGHADPARDVEHRLRVMRDAVERAHGAADPDPAVLKVFVAPEFFWRGRDGAYFFDDDNDGGEQEHDEAGASHDPCGPVCQVLSGLEDLTANKTYQDWLFLMGTVITAEKLPKEDAWDYLFLNFAPLYRGFDPDQTTHLGQRFLVPKRYVSNIDFLTPLRHYNATLAREIIDEQEQEQQQRRRQDPGDKGQQDDKKKRSKSKAASDRATGAGAPVFNPFLDRGRYSNHVWDSYKAELRGLEYTMIEYGWIVVDGIAMTVEVCLDHDMGTALNSFTADAVTGRTTRIPNVDPFLSELSEVAIPPSMAQLGLVSSAGMTVNRASIASTDGGYVFLQDGLNDRASRMYYESECYAGLTFEGGTELVRRSALVTPNDVVLEYQVVQTDAVAGAAVERRPVYEERPAAHGGGGGGRDWKSQVRGVFSTAKYEPTLVVYPSLDLPAYPPASA